MARVSNRQIANVFRAAKKILWDGNSRNHFNIHHICSAISRTNYDYYKFSRPAAWAARNVIMDRLGYRTVERYLIYKVGVPKKHLTDKNIQAFRHRWLDSLIEEFDNKR